MSRTEANLCGSHSTVCNFMSHEKCLKHVKAPCASLAPSLVHVRMECGFLQPLGVVVGGDSGSCGRSWARRQYGRLDGAGSGTSTSGLGGSVPLCWSGSLSCIAYEPLQGSRWASLPAGSDPISGVPGTKHCLSCLSVGLPSTVSSRWPQMHHGGAGLSEWAVKLGQAQAEAAGS